MRDKRIRFASLLAVCLLPLGAVPATAQPSIDLKAEIPFAFFVGGEKLPPGTYIVENFPANETSPVLSVERVDAAEGQRHFVAVNTLPVDPEGPTQEHPRLVFEEVGRANLLVKVIPFDAGARKIDR